MQSESTVNFQPPSRIHMGLAVKRLDQSVDFYRTLFGQEPTKSRPGYAKFEVAEPLVNLSLNEVGGEAGPSNAVAHFGIQVKSTRAVQAIADRLEQAGFKTRKEEKVTCCYAVQNKIWVSDPDGNQWEAYQVLDDQGAHHHSSQSECCADLKQAVHQANLAATHSTRQNVETACQPNVATACQPKSANECQPKSANECQPKSANECQPKSANECMCGTGN